MSKPIPEALSPARLAVTTIWPRAIWERAFNGWNGTAYDWAWFVDAVTKLGVNPLEFQGHLDTAMQPSEEATT